MVSEQYEIVARLNPGSTVSDFDRLFAQIAQKSRELEQQKLKFGQPDPAELQKLTGLIQDAIRKGASGSSAFSSDMANKVGAGVAKSLQEGILSASGSTSKFLKEQATLFARQIDLAVANATQRASRNTSGFAFVRERDLNPASPTNRNLFRVDSATGAAAQTAADKKVATAVAAYEGASSALTNAIKREAKAHDDAAAATRRAEERDGSERLALIRRRDADLRQRNRELGQGIGRSLRNFSDPFGLQGIVDARTRDPILEEFRRLQQIPFASPDTSTSRGRAQEQINQATIAREAAARRLAAEEAKAVPDLERLRTAWNDQRRASERLAAAQHRLSIVEAARPPQAVQGVFAQFREGFRGQADVPYAQQIGQAFKFSVLYGAAYKALFAFTQTMQATLQEGIEFQTAVSELKLATGQSAEAAQDLANTLGRISVDAGFAPSQGALAGARAVGLYGATQADPNTQRFISELSTQVGSRLAFSSGMQIEDIQTRLAAITNAFQLGVAGQGRVADLDAFFAKRFGVAPGATIRTVAEVGSVGQSAGFNLEEVNAIAALIMGRTGQTDSAVAGQLAQIFSRGGEGSLTAVASRYGIDTESSTLAEQMKQLADVYRSATPSEQNQIAAAFGRGRVQNTISILLGSFDDVSRAANDAASGLAEGAADEAFSERMNNIGGQLQRLLANFKELANNLGQSGVLASLGLLVEGLNQLLESANGLLSVWNEMSPVLRSVIASLGLLALAAKTGAGQSLLTGLAARGGGAVGVAAPGFVGTRAGGIASVGSRAALSTYAAGAGAALLAGAPWLLATAGVVALGELASASTRLREKMESAEAALGADPSGLVSPEQLEASAKELRDLVKRDGVSGLNENILNFLGGGDTARRERGLDADGRALAEFREARAKALESAPAERSNFLLPLDQAGLAEGLDAMTLSGTSAKERLDAVAASLLGAGDAAERARRSFDANDLSGRVAEQIAKGFGAEGAPLGSYRDNMGADRFLDLTSPFRDVDQSYVGQREGLRAADIQKKLVEALLASGIRSEADLSGDNLDRVADELLNQLPVDDLRNADGSKATKDQVKALRLHLRNVVVAELGKQVEDVKLILDENRALTEQEMREGIAQLLAQAQAALQALPESDFIGRGRVLRGVVRTIRAAIARNQAAGQAPAEQDLIDLQQAKQALLENEFERAQRVLQVAQQNAGSNAAAARLADSFVRTWINRAVRAGAAGTDILVQLISNAGEGARAIARQAVQTAITAARAAMAEARKAIDSSEGFAQSPALQAAFDELRGLQNQLGAVESAPSSGEPGVAGNFATDFPGYKPPEKGPSPEDQKRRAEEARRRALAIRSSLRLLAIDITDPLALARAAVADALDQVKHAVDRESRLAGRVDLRRARAELEATRFQQRLEAVQTAEELGRISHAKYINYLENERDRLKSIKDRTYQQQKQLDEVERLLKASAETMQGQWNFGDIRMPTPYEVRRRIKELYPNEQNGISGIVSGAAPGATRMTQIYIDGTDVGQVLRIIRQYVGSSTTVRAGTPSRR